MKVDLVSFSDTMGGASIAACRVNWALRKFGIDSTLNVQIKNSRDEFCNEVPTTYMRCAKKFNSFAEHTLLNVFSRKRDELRTAALLQSGWPRTMNSRSSNLINLHWFSHGMLSVEDLTRFNKPLVWTLHDMWAFCGTEHYTEEKRWLEGYDKSFCHLPEIDFDRWVWRKKKKAWTKPFQIITPSQWLKNCVESSALFKDWPVTLIGYPIDLETWKPCDKIAARQGLGLPLDKKLVLFGAVGGTSDPRKGFKFVRDALIQLSAERTDVVGVVFGGGGVRSYSHEGVTIINLGVQKNPNTIAQIYNASDVFVLPSTQDNLPNTGIEAQACGVPVVGFRVGGLPDIIEHKATGFLADPYDVYDLKDGISWALAFNKSQAQYTRERACRKWHYSTISAQYRSVFAEAIKGHNS